MKDESELIWESYVSNNSISAPAQLDLEGSAGIRKSVADTVYAMKDADKLQLGKDLGVNSVSMIIHKLLEMGEPTCQYWLENVLFFYQEDPQSNWGTLAYHHHK